MPPRSHRLSLSDLRRTGIGLSWQPAVAILAALSLLLPACAAPQARQQAQQVSRDNDLRVQGWYVAQAQLVKMCAPPTSRADCAARYVKRSPWIADLDDWQWIAMPSYETIVAVHEYSIRSLTPQPPIYIEYVIAAARYLAAETDARRLSPEGFRSAFTEVWNWMGNQLRQHHQLVVLSLREAEESDFRTTGMVIAGLAVVLGAAALTARTSPPLPPAAQPAYAQPQMTQPIQSPARSIICEIQPTPYTAPVRTARVVCR